MEAGEYYYCEVCGNRHRNGSEISTKHKRKAKAGRRKKRKRK